MGAFVARAQAAENQPVHMQTPPRRADSDPLDPRSPSFPGATFTRTPLSSEQPLVKDPLDPRSPCFRTPRGVWAGASQHLLDPRSPGVQRTPLVNASSSAVAPVEQVAFQELEPAATPARPEQEDSVEDVFESVDEEKNEGFEQELSQSFASQSSADREVAMRRVSSESASRSETQVGVPRDDNELEQDLKTSPRVASLGFFREVSLEEAQEDGRPFNPLPVSSSHRRGISVDTGMAAQKTQLNAIKSTIKTFARDARSPLSQVTNSPKPSSSAAPLDVEERASPQPQAIRLTGPQRESLRF
eukprot:m.76839 g.76839  ORF g.76839 m.76839 type:complete len:302 (+) comp50462_c0_seq1:364-1269(+)